jgi:hypothetical protein
MASRGLDANVRESLMRGTEDLWKRLREVVTHMVDRLNEPESRFHGSLVSNILDLVEILRSIPKPNFVTSCPISRNSMLRSRFVDFPSCSELAHKKRHQEKDREDGGDHAAHHYPSQRLLTLRSNSVGDGSGQQANSSRMQAMTTGRISSSEPFSRPPSKPSSSCARQMPARNTTAPGVATPVSDVKPTAAEMLKEVPVKKSARRSPKTDQISANLSPSSRFPKAQPNRLLPVVTMSRFDCEHNRKLKKQ